MRIYQIITAEGIASLRKLGILCRVSFDNPVIVLKQEEENLTYSASNKTFIQLEILFDTAAPLLPRPDLKTRSQQTGKCSEVVIPVHITIWMTMF